MADTGTGRTAPTSAVFLVTALSLATVVAVGFWGFSYDDNFITYRYAWNVAAGEGLVFNSGERVLGTSAPGYALALAVLSFFTRPLGIDITHLGALISLGSLLMVGWVMERGGVAFGPLRSWQVALAFVALAVSSQLNLRLLGSEFFPVLALIVLATYLLFNNDRPTSAGVLVGLAMCFRLDAGIAALALGLVAWVNRRRLPLRYAVSGIGVLSLWLLFLQLYFGRVIPNTLGGKTALREVPYSLRQWQSLTAMLGQGVGVFVLAVAALGLWWVIRRDLWRHPAVIALAGWIVAHEVAYRMIGVWFAIWYHVYLWHVVLALFAVGAFELARFAASLLRRNPSPVLLCCFYLVVLAPVLLPSLKFVAETWRQPPEPRYRIYEQVGHYLNEHVDPKSEVLAVEIGVLGYFSERRILDLGALISPEFTEAKFTNSRAQLVAQLKPKWIVAGSPDALMDGVLSHDGTEGNYEEVARYSNESIGSLVRILRRREGELAPPDQ